ncbi:MAG: choice-of-anchor D domain-containing protein, partial [Rhodothermales bacterium]|nr:choice-of-anchor D domain-containing protein [Rhodothermales bacterium]
ALPPAIVGNDSGRSTGTVDLDPSLVASGLNEATFAFASDLNGSTGGYWVYEVSLTLSLCDASSDAAPVVAADPGALDFGDVTVGESDTQTLTVSNAGDADLTVSDVAITGAEAASFTFDGPTSFVLGPGEMQDFDVTFSPTSASAKSATLTVESDADNDTSLDVALSGNGEPAPAPAVATDPTSLGFGSITVGSSNAKTLTVSNAGDADLTVSDVTIGGADAGAFSLAGGTPTSFTLAPGGSQDLSVVFSPSSAGDKSATLTIESDASNDASFDVPLSGEGTEAPDPLIAVDPEDGQFGTVAVGASKTQAITVTNTGGADLTVSDVAIGGEDADVFSLAGGSPTSFTLAPSATQDLSVRFSPVTAGARDAVLVLTSDAANAPSLELLLEGEAESTPSECNPQTAEEKTISATGLPLTFFGKPVGTELTATFDLDPGEILAASITVTAADIDAPEEAALRINGTDVPLPPEISTDDAPILTGTSEIDPAVLVAGENAATFVFASDLDGTTSGYEIRRFDLTLEQC